MNELEQIRENEQLKGLEAHLQNDSDSFEVKLDTNPITGEKLINYFVVGDTFFYDESAPRHKYCAPNAEIIKRNYFTRPEKDSFTKINPGQIEVVNVVPNTLEDTSVKLIFCRDIEKLNQMKACCNYKHLFDN
jgi:hypothetical protein